jgi:glycosyltransferase involved in cell wall biosynthesis
MKPLITIGLPSFNEANSIAKVTHDIDTALQKLPYAATLVNADNRSADGTVENFLATPTTFPKISILTDIAGKGSNLKSILEYVIRSDSHAVLFIDTDLSEVPSIWVESLLGKIMAGYDAAFSRRTPKWNGGDLTYHLTYPMIVQFWNANIHEPISGDFAFSNAFCRKALAENWESPKFGYGVDFFFSTVAAQMKWSEVILPGRKIHPPRSYFIKDMDIMTMRPKFEEVLLSIKYCIQNKAAEPSFRTHQIKTVVDGIPFWDYATVPEFDQDIDALIATVQNKYNWSKELIHSFDNRLPGFFTAVPFQGIPFGIWIDALLKFFFDRYSQLLFRDIIDLIETLFFARLIGFFYEVKGRNDWYQQIEKDAANYSPQL